LVAGITIPEPLFRNLAGFPSRCKTKRQVVDPEKDILFVAKHEFDQLVCQGEAVLICSTKVGRAGRMNNTVHLLFEFFERLISALLLIGMVVVIGLAAWSFLRLTYIVSSDPLVDIGYVTFQTLFDRLLAAVIALELARSVLLLVEGHRGLMQVRIILVIGLLAVVRKLILIELEAADPALLFALAAAVLALAASLVLIMYMDPKRDRQE